MLVDNIKWHWVSLIHGLLWMRERAAVSGIQWWLRTGGMMKIAIWYLVRQLCRDTTCTLFDDSKLQMKKYNTQHTAVTTPRTQITTSCQHSIPQLRLTAIHTPCSNGSLTKCLFVSISTTQCIKNEIFLLANLSFLWRPGTLSNTMLLGTTRCPCHMASQLILSNGFSRVHVCGRWHN